MSVSVFAAATGFLRKVGDQAAVSVAASTMAAAALTFSGTVGRSFIAPPAGQAESRAEAADVQPSPIGPDGKIGIRHRDAGDAETPMRIADGRGLVTPAAILMPMALTWTQPADDGAALLRSAPRGEARARVVQAQVLQPQVVQSQVLPPRRPVIERVASVAENRPLVPTPTLQVAADAAEPNEASGTAQQGQARRGLFGLNVPGRVGNAVTGAVGLVGAAGSWTLARASDLLPRL